jgi:uncharacterized protein (TIGR00369 family)
MTEQRVSLEELQAFFTREFPQASVTIEQLEPGRARVRQTIGHEQLRPGGTVSGPVMMAVADSASYAAILSRIGIVPLAVTTSLNINFLRKPSADAAIVGDASILKLGRLLAVCEVRIYSEGGAEPVANATVTYAIPPTRPDAGVGETRVIGPEPAESSPAGTR